MMLFTRICRAGTSLYVYASRIGAHFIVAVVRVRSLRCSLPLLRCCAMGCCVAVRYTAVRYAFCGTACIYVVCLRLRASQVRSCDVARYAVRSMLPFTHFICALLQSAVARSLRVGDLRRSVRCRYILLLRGYVAVTCDRSIRYWVRTALSLRCVAAHRCTRCTIVAFVASLQVRCAIVAPALPCCDACTVARSLRCVTEYCYLPHRYAIVAYRCAAVTRLLRTGAVTV